VLLTCGAPLADGVFIGRGLSFEVAVLGVCVPGGGVRDGCGSVIQAS